MAVVLLAAWTRSPSPWILPGVALLVLLHALGPPSRRPWVPLASMLLLLAVAAGFAADHQLRRIGLEWTEMWAQRETELAERLTSALDDLVAAGDEALEDAAALPSTSDPAEHHAALERILKRRGLDAVAVYGPPPDRRLIVWAGTHRGRVPAEVRRGDQGYAYGERPLFSYLYFTAPVPDAGGTIVAAALLRADLPPALGADPGDFASRFRDRTGEDIRITRAERAAGSGVWDFQWAGEPLFSVSLDRPSQEARRLRTGVHWSRGVAGLVVLAWLLLAVGGRGWAGHSALSVGSLLAVFLILPFGALLGLSGLFSPAEFLLPGPLDVTLGRLLALGAAGGVAAGLLLRSGGPARGWAVLAVPVLFPALVWLFQEGPSAGLLAGGEDRWILYVVTLGLLLSLVAGVALAGAGGGEPEPGPLPRMWIPVALAVALGAVLGYSAARAVSLSPLWAAAWLIPTVAAVPSLRAWRLSSRPPLLWGLAVVVGGSAALPFAWSARIEANMTLAEGRLERLGVEVDPYLEFLLHRLGERADSLWSAGAGPVEILYRSWVGSGLAEEGYPIWLTLWSAGGIPLEELRIGVTEPRPPVAGEALAEVGQGEEVLVRRLETATAQYLAAHRLPDGRVVTGVVPLRSDPARGFPLGPLFAPGELGERPRLTLVPLLPGDAPQTGEEVLWVRVEAGWRAESSIRRPDGMYRAFYSLELPSPPVLGARATLLLVLVLAVFAGLWGSGWLIAHGWRTPFGAWKDALSSFRGRVTLTLFGFFLLSVAIFGTLAYRTLTGAALRTARALAERVVQEGSEWYLDVQGSMDLLARRVGADLLEYRGGELRGGSVEELVELGLYRGWVPYPIHSALERREALQLSIDSNLGEWESVVAYQRLPDGDVLASHVPLEAGAIAVRRREVADLLGFAVVMGALLSLGLALLVGRALARPIQTLQVASERVGSGNLRVRLPEDRRDEFGSVFSAFNRMVFRLRRARRDLVRTTRRTQAIVEEAATGVIALDPSGRVTLVNPRAGELLEEEIAVGKALADALERAEELARWVDLYFRDGLREAGTELQMGERRIRVRARRISRRGPLGGAVLSLEDVTDELRSERILAWGEMAQQVAHEVKNPLTPIKLSVQHVQRAWEDRRPDFEDILARNVEVILREIDRLAAIARSFARFRAPEAAGELPLEPVEVTDVVDEVLALYAAGEGPIRFESRIPAGLPPARARSSELREVLVNLLENARAAIPEEGRVIVEAEWTEDAVEMRVRDDGGGIPPHLLSRVFEPQFSTRSTGTGLGLAIVRRLVDSWDGVVSVSSRVGKGTVITLWLQPWTGGSEGGERPGAEGAMGSI